MPNSIMDAINRYVHRTFRLFFSQSAVLERYLILEILETCSHFQYCSQRKIDFKLDRVNRWNNFLSFANFRISYMYWMHIVHDLIILYTKHMYSFVESILRIKKITKEYGETVKFLPEVQSRIFMYTCRVCWRSDIAITVVAVAIRCYKMNDEWN